jgi:pyridoxal phosphate enzyme (YggS family)
MNNLKENLDRVRSRVESACQKAGRKPENIATLAVSKKHSAQQIRLLHEFGQQSFGENYVQEALAKMAQLEDLNLEWHYIGPIQSNKTRDVAEHFHWVQSADRKKIIQRLSNQRPGKLAPLNFCIQVNIDREPQKAGVLPEQVRELALWAQDMGNLRLRGLMTIPRLTSTENELAESYERMNALYHELLGEGMDLDTLSMGMSADLETAIMHGSTMIRIGTDLFGPRIPAGTV